MRPTGSRLIDLRREKGGHCVPLIRTTRQLCRRTRAQTRFPAKAHCRTTSTPLRVAVPPVCPIEVVRSREHPRSKSSPHFSQHRCPVHPPSSLKTQDRTDYNCIMCSQLNSTLRMSSSGGVGCALRSLIATMYGSAPKRGALHSERGGITMRLESERGGITMRLESSVSRIGPLIAVFVAATMFFAWPAPTSAQDCGWCATHTIWYINYHSFGPVAETHHCGAAGCHTWLGPDRCGEHHDPCYLKPLLGAESAIIGDSSQDLKEVLASSDNWEYDAVDRSLSFACSGYAVGRYVLSEELAKVVMTLFRPTMTETDRSGPSRVRKAAVSERPRQ